MHVTRTVRQLFAAALLFALSPIPVIAQSSDAEDESATEDIRETRSLGDVPHVDADAVIDGILDEPIWARALVVSLDYETNPGENIPPPVETFVYLAENGSQLLVAFDARDPNPENIRAYLRDRDEGWDDDLVGIIIDTFDDQRRAFEFFVNPLGVQMDLTLDDVNGGESDAWNAIWSSAGRITDTGFIVEMAIPFSQLRFQSSRQAQQWGFEGLRFRPRGNRVRISSNPQARGRNCYLCQIDKVQGFANIESGKGLEIVPALTAQRADQRDTVSGPMIAGDSETDAGMNVRWAVTPDLIANFTLNPDFSQVEADVAQLDVNNQFALFFPETRAFFLEGADYFSTPINAVFTRTIADPDFGAKLTGNHGPSAFGLLAAEDTVTNLLFPGPLSSRNGTLEQNSRTIAGRYRRNLEIGDGSAIGALLTSRTGSGYENIVSGFDGRLRPTDDHSIRFQYLNSQTQYPESIVEDFDQPEERFGGNAFVMNYNYGTRDWFAGSNYQRFDHGFRVDTGFRTQVDMENRSLFFGRIWWSEDDRWWNRIQVGYDISDRHRGDGVLLRKNHQLFVNANARRETFMRLSLSDRQQYWNGVLYDIDNTFVLLRVRPAGSFFLGVATGKGDQIDFSNSRLGKQVFVEPFFTWTPTRRLRINFRGNFRTLETQQGEEIFDADLLDLRTTWQFNTRSFLRLTVQEQTVERNMAQFVSQNFDASSKSRGTQLLYSYQLNPQTVVFAGYSDNQLRDDEYLTLTKTDQTFFLKFSYAWVPR
jgi:hypothetical protein